MKHFSRYFKIQNGVPIDHRTTYSLLSAKIRVCKHRHSKRNIYKLFDISIDICSESMKEIKVGVSD